MNRGNSEMSREGCFKFSISRKGAKYKPKRLPHSMKESPVTLAVRPNGLQCCIEKTREQFLLSKDNICGLETGRIVLPSKKCWGGGKREYHNYLMVVLHGEQTAEMILLLTEQTGNTDEDQITTNWKWFIQNKLDFVNSWPNVAVDYHESPQSKVQSKQVTLMLGKTWLSIFKYHNESLPSYWKYFRILQITVDLVRIRLTDGLESEACVIKILSDNRAHSEKFVIKSRRRGDIYGYIQTYISPPPTPVRPTDLAPLPSSSREDSSLTLSSSSTDTTEAKKIYSSRSSQQIVQELPYIRQTYLISHRGGMYFANPLPLVSAAATSPQINRTVPPPVSHCQGSLRTSSPVQFSDSDLPPPTPCRGSRSPTSVEDLGYLDRPYLDMKRSKSYTPSVALLGVNSPMNSSPSSPDLRFTSGLKYISVLGPHEATLSPHLNKNLLTIRPSPFYKTRSFQPDLSPVYDESNSSSFYLEEENRRGEETPLQAVENDTLPESDIMFEITIDEDHPDIKKAPTSPFVESDFDVPCPPRPCKLSNARNPCFYRSLSMPRNRSSYSTCITDSERRAKQMQRWKDELNLTLPRQQDQLYVQPDSEHHRPTSWYSGDVDSYSYNAEFYESGNDYDLYDLNFLLFPLNNLSEDKKEEVFDWVTVHNRSLSDKPQENIHRNIQPQLDSSDNNVSTESLPGERRYKRSTRKKKKSLSSSALNDTSCFGGRRSSDFYSYWSATNICRTLDKIMTNKLPLPDTLGLSRPIRKELCMRLYTLPINSGQYSWETLAGVIGLEEDSVNLIELYIQNHSAKYTAADIVLRHWQFMYNKGKCSEACTKENLLYILQYKLERHDLVQLLQKEEKISNTPSNGSSQTEHKDRFPRREVDEREENRELGSGDTSLVKRRLDEERPGEDSETLLKPPFDVAMPNTWCTTQVCKDGGEPERHATTYSKNEDKEAVENTCYTSPLTNNSSNTTDEKKRIHEGLVGKDDGTFVTPMTTDTTDVKHLMNDEAECKCSNSKVNQTSHGYVNCNNTSDKKSFGETEETLVKEYRAQQDIMEYCPCEEDHFNATVESLNNNDLKFDSKNHLGGEVVSENGKAIPSMPKSGTDTAVVSNTASSEDRNKIIEHEDDSEPVLKTTVAEGCSHEVLTRSSSQAELLCKKVAQSIRSPSSVHKPVIKPLIKPKPFVVKKNISTEITQVLKRSDV